MSAGETVDSRQPTYADFVSRIVDHVDGPIFVKDREFRFVLVNETFCRFVGRTSDQLLGRTDYDFLPEAEADFFRRKDEEVFATGREVRFEEETITPSHGRRLLTTRKVPLHDASGAVTHLVGIVHDVTAEKETQERLRQLNEQLEARIAERTAALAAAQEELVRKERLAILGQIAGGLAHQVRSPLGAIANAAQLLKRTTAISDAGVAGPVELILEEVWRANRTINGLLDFARVRPAQVGPADLAEIIHRALAGQLIPDAVEICEEIAELPAVECDAEQVREAIANLVHNAVDAMPAGGRLTVSARLEPAAAVIGVADTGTGIAPDVAARLFEPLVTTKPTGVGLGLTTAKRLVENQRGTLRFDTWPGKGTRFEIRLPCAAVEDEAEFDLAL